MITKELVELIYEAASIQRWNDHIRPHKGFAELDKQSHKMIFAYVLAKLEESDRKAELNWRRLIEGGIFEFLHRIVLTDIKPPIFHRLMAEKGGKLTGWVLQRLRGKVDSASFFDRMERYLTEPDFCLKEKKLLRAAHYLATNWEFKIIYNLNCGLYGLAETKAKIEGEIEEHYDLAGVQKLQLGKKTANFMDLAGQLRFQQRWAQTPRVPETSVAGHMLIVAMLSYFISVELDACDSRVYNNFFGGLFHDLPEVLTRDIVSPVKKSVEGLEGLIKEIEQRQLEEKLLPLLPPAWHREIKYFTENEFENRLFMDGAVRFVGSGEISARYNTDSACPLDGEILRFCDHYAAYVEACLSLSHGIRSAALAEGQRELYRLYEGRHISGINVGRVFDYFKTW